MVKEVKRSIAQHIRRVTDRHDLWSVWSDFVEMSAIAVSNGVDLVHRAEREARYMAIVDKYSRSEPQAVARFAEAFGALVVEFEGGIDDVLGRTFMDFELGSKWAGQFFTPFSICRMMAELQVGDMPALVAERGFVTASDPAVGAGAMPLALCAAMHDAGINYQNHLHVTAQDIDERAAHMAYIQLALVGVPATVIVGDTLRMETRAVWYTPAHVMGGWSMRLASRERQPRLQPPARQPERPVPSPAQLVLI